MIASRPDGQLRLISRGDRVLVRWASTGSPTRRLILLAGPDGRARSRFADAALRSWSELGAVATLDLPLCGERHSDKLSAAAFVPGNPLAARLRGDLAQQLCADLGELIRALDHPLGLSAGTRLAYVGIERGAALADAFCEAHPELEVIVLAAREDAALSRPAHAHLVDPPHRDRSPAGWLEKIGKRLAARAVRS
ncbi:MAG: hypothetical protein ACE5FG_08135 [Myxococcota bacterium]